MHHTLIFKSKWGWMGLAESPKGLSSLVLSKPTKQAVLDEWSTVGLVPGVPSARLRAAKKQLVEYLAGKRTAFSIPVDLSAGTVFQRRVWKALLALPYGQLSSYRNLAAVVGGRQYARAVGNAVGANPLPVLVPCHRVVAHDGSMGGFSCGLPVKRKLLALEGSLARLTPGR